MPQSQRWTLTSPLALAPMGNLNTPTLPSKPLPIPCLLYTPAHLPPVKNLFQSILDWSLTFEGWCGFYQDGWGMVNKYTIGGFRFPRWKQTWKQRFWGWPLTCGHDVTFRCSGERLSKPSYSLTMNASSQVSRDQSSQCPTSGHTISVIYQGHLSLTLIGL